MTFLCCTRPRPVQNSAFHVCLVKKVEVIRCKVLIQQLYTFRVNGSGMQLYATGSVRKGQYRYKISPITVKRCSNKIGYYLNFFGRLHFHLYERKTCWCLCSLAFPYPLLFDWQRKCHHTPQNKVDLKYLLSPHNLIAVYFCIKRTTLSFYREAD